MYIWHNSSDDRQNTKDKSHIGGVPLLPKGVGVPVFTKSSTPMTFFFQLEFPSNHKWAGHIVSVFAVTDFKEKGMTIPRLPSPLEGAILDSNFFQNYETFFKFFVFETRDAERPFEFTERVAYRKLEFADHLPTGTVHFGSINSAPEWVLGDEAPISFNGKADVIDFLFQTKADYEFSTVANAPRQQELAYSGASGSTEDSLVPEYTLFVSNELYFFGISDEGKKLIYLVPQS